MSDVTLILSKIEAGDPTAAKELLPLVYDELRKLAGSRMAAERPDHTLQATALVHEAYIRLVDVQQVQHWNSRGHFFGAAAEAMRRIAIERARARATQKRGGNAGRVHLDQLAERADESAEDLLQLNEALSLLEKHDAQAAALVKLRFFAGLGHQEAADALGITRRVADRLWALSRAWLYREVTDA
jgi:RNA polymerase sigma factor (TIGR02999 family)